MKKKTASILVLITLLFGCLFLTGCSYDEAKRKIETKEGAEEYLKQAFPNEKFEVSEREDIEIQDYTTSEGYLYRIKSKNTGIEFILKNGKAGSGGIYHYVIDCDYFDKALEKYTKEFNNEKIVFDGEGYTNRIRITRSDFSSKEELWNLLNDFKNYLKNREPFKSMEKNDFKLDVYIDHGERYKYQTIRLFDDFSVDEIEFD